MSSKFKIPIVSGLLLLGAINSEGILLDNARPLIEREANPRVTASKYSYPTMGTLSPLYTKRLMEPSFPKPDMALKSERLSYTIVGCRKPFKGRVWKLCYDDHRCGPAS